MNENVTTPGVMNSTTSTPVLGGPPPIGYYGDTRVMMWKVIPPIIITVGIIGNILTVIVLIRQKIKSLSSTAVYLLALAISDTLILFSGPLRNWIKHNYDIDVRYLSDSGCKAQLYITYVSIHLSSWLLVAVTMDRVVSVVFPQRTNLLCSRKTASIVTMAIMVIILSINMVLPITTKLNGSVSGHTCSPATKEFLEFRDKVFCWIDLLVAFLLPFLILLTGNILIIINIVKIKRNAIYSINKTKINATKSLTILLIALCVIFFVTMAPVSIFHIYSPKRFAEIKQMKDPYAQWHAYQYVQFQHTVVNMIGYTNASINFLLYVFSGPKFRKELTALLCCRHSINNDIFGSSDTTKMSINENNHVNIDQHESDTKF